MAFLTDQQTLDDLNIFGKRGSDPIYGIFNRTATRQGAALLEEMFRYPLSDAASINQRSAVFQYFASNGLSFPFQSELFDVTEQYMAVTDERTRLSGESRKLTSLLGEDNEYKTITRGISALITLLQSLQLFLKGLGTGSPYDGEKSAIDLLLAEQGLQSLLRESGKGKLPHEKVIVYDGYLRFRHRDTVRRLLQHVYQLDVYLSVARVAAERGFVFPLARPAEEQRFLMEGMYHPQVKGAVPNSLEITSGGHVIFLTGANMAGKSTFMKTLGINLFLGHMGFPLPAGRMEFSVLDGIFTTINLPDNLGLGASHFYAEVLRVKKIARELGRGKRLFVIFDELFRGTNVKDAYEATVALTNAFAGKTTSLFIISTHIIEAGPVLAEMSAAIRFLYLPTGMNGNTPVYTYTLEQGITDDRHGMVIIHNEGILDILKNGLP